MKAAFISTLSFLFCLKATAQTNYYKLGIGAGYGFTQSFTDVQRHDFARAAYGDMDFFFTPFLSVGGELQYGKIKAGNAATEVNEREFVNSYKAFTINGKLYLGALVDYERNTIVNTIKWLYIGGGAGIISNSMTTIARTQKSTGYRFPGKTSSKELDIPVNLGINFYFFGQDKPKFAINLNIQSNITIGEGLDGYDDSIINFKSGSPDIYNYYSVGIKYQFGFIGLSKKSLY